VSLRHGTRLGIYEITGQIGAGGMGEVYRAADSKLGREVAIKTLPATLAGDADRLARFEREAKLLASLNHAHIASVYGLDEQDGTVYIAMELVEGETLEEKLKRGPLPVEDALRLGLQIAQALEAAHDKGVVHRDLKPANVMVTPEGVVKVLDFGLAKAVSGDPDTASAAHSPALSLAMTQAGLVLGTAGYMSPEQASGQATDQRADIWAFGVVLYEMLTGMPLFSGESVPHILAAVLQADPDWSRLPKHLHPRLRQMLERCLEKKVRSRYHSIADVRVDIEAVLNDPAGALVRPGTAGSGAPVPLQQRVLPWAAGLVLASLAGLAAWTLKAPEPGPIIRSVHTLPEGREFPYTHLPMVTIAPDGQQFVYTTGEGLYLHRMDGFDDVLIDGSSVNFQSGEVSFDPVFSPDAQSLAYVVGSAALDYELTRLPVSGGAPNRLVSVGNGRITAVGLGWESDGTILFPLEGGIWRVSANGGEPVRIIELQAGEQATQAQLLPGGDWVLFSVIRGDEFNDWDTAEIVAESLTTHERRVLHAGSSARYAPTGHLIYALGNTLYAARFDVDAVELFGEPVQVVQGVSRNTDLTGVAHYDFSRDGTLVYMPGAATAVAVDSGGGTLAIVGHDGSVRTLPVPDGVIADPRVSPDGRSAAYTFTYPDGDDITVYELGSNAAPLRLTFGGVGRFPVWSADGKHLAFQSTRDGTPSLYSQLADGSGEEPVLLTTAADGESYTPESFSPDGQKLLFTVRKGNERAIWILDLETQESEPLVSDAGVDYSEPAFSPNGQWIAYQSQQGGLVEVWLQPYPAGNKRQLPRAGIEDPAWSPDGSELFYLGLAFESVQITAEPRFGIGPAETLTDRLLRVAPPVRRQYDVMPDGSGFLGFVAAAAPHEIYIVSAKTTTPCSSR
jgi:Tol biopolymer transport system component/predicted Ser/Thr protein kinase